MKILLIFPPQWIPTSPHLAIPLLSSQLRNAGFQTDVLDLNIDFYNAFVSSSNLREALTSAEAIAATPNADKAHNRRKEYITDYLKQNFDVIPDVINNIADYCRVFRDKELFYNPDTLFKAKAMLNKALEIASLPYAPARIAFDNYYSDSAFSYSPENLRLLSASPENNLFYKYIRSAVPDILNGCYDIIGVSVADLSQLLASVTLMRMLKENSSAFVLLGGNYVTQIRDDINDTPEFFEYCDGVLFGDGEKSIVELAHRIESNRDLSGIPGLSIKGRYANQGISSDESLEMTGLNSLAFPCFDGYKLNEYFIPETVFPVQLSKGCYWGKCSFCDYFNAQPHFCIKSVQRAVDEIEYYCKSCKASEFFIIDEAVPADYYNCLSDELIKRQLNISFYAFARLEDDFTYELLQKMRTAGARLLMWGYECQSTRVMKLINKGIDIDKRLEILERSAQAGIWNNGLFIIGYPTETLNEINDTVETVKKNTDIIHSATLANFNLLKNSVLGKELKEKNAAVSRQHFVKKIYSSEPDSISYHEALVARRNADESIKRQQPLTPWTTVYSDFEHLLLYICKYGVSGVKAIAVKSLYKGDI